MPPVAGLPRATARRALILLLATLLAVGMIAASAAQPASAAGTWKPPTGRALRTMIVGDSISNGYERDATWRYRLWQWTKAGGGTGPDLDFVGPHTGTNPQTEPHAPTPPPAQGETAASAPQRFTGAYAPGVRFDSAHYAMWGRQLAQDVPTIRDTMTSGTGGAVPDLLLVELGFNDLGWAGADAGLTDTMKRFVDQARAANPDIAIVLANAPQRTTLGEGSTLPQRTRDYNAALAKAIPTWSTAASPVVMADFDAAYGCDPAATSCASTYDGLHPNALGEHRIAHAFEAALHDGLHLGSTVPAVPAASSIPRRVVATPKNVRFDGTQQGVTATWDKVSGAHGYDIQYRDVTADPNGAWQNATSPFARWDRPWDFSGSTVAGHRYEVRVRASAGDGADLKSAWSAPVRGTAAPTTASAPAHITATAAGNGTLDLAWDPAAGPHADTVTTYGVSVWDQAGGFPQGFGVKAPGHTAHVTGLVPGHRYVVLVTSWNKAGEGLPGSSGEVVAR